MTARNITRRVMRMALVLALSLAAAAIAKSGLAGEGDVCEGVQHKVLRACTAYCEKLDCDGDPDAPVKKCFKVADRYQRLTGELPPCVCPCGFEPSLLVQSQFWEPSQVECTELSGSGVLTLTDGQSTVQTLPGYAADPDLFTCSAFLFDGFIGFDIFPTAASETQIATCNWRIREAAALLGATCE